MFYLKYTLKIRWQSLKCYIIHAGGGKACTNKKMYWFDREGAYGRKLTASKSGYESDWQVYIKLRIFLLG